MRRRERIGRTTVGAAWIAATLAACGGGGGDGASGSPSTGAPADAPAPAASAPAAPAAASTTPATSTNTPTGPAATPTSEKTFPDRVVEALNAARAVPRSCGGTAFPAAGPLRWQAQTEQAALTQAQYLQQNNLFTHTGANGSSVGDRLTTTGYTWQSVGENLAAGYSDFAAVLQGWIDSPGHCINVMNGNYVDVGVVLVQGTSSNTYRTYWAMVLGRPR
ncbi:MAG: CAP domain-containing protein [Burkholderiaceae bacterium]|nr:CAP domain-containing protein [Burkholderiales bacterium]MCZ8338701.1 CAP domain-containing protein [Burkholderiaceae bacterium]